MKRTLAISIAVCGLIGVSSAANAKPARCEIKSYTNEYVGPCEFRASKGSFELDLPQSASGKFGTQFYYVEITSPGQGALYSDWVNRGRQFEESVERDPKKPACWVGEGWRVCVY